MIQDIDNRYIRITKTNVRQVLCWLERKYPTLRWAEGQRPTEYTPVRLHSVDTCLIIYHKVLKVNNNVPDYPPFKELIVDSILDIRKELTSA